MSKTSFLNSLSRRDALAGLSAAAGAAALSGGPALAQSGIVTWNINNLKSIGGHPVFVIGDPKVIKTAAGNAVEFDGVDDQLVVEKHPLEGYAQWTEELLLRADGGKETAQRIFHLAELDKVTGLPVTATAQNPTADSNRRFMFELRVDGSNVYFESFTAGPGGLSSALIVKEKQHPAGTWHVITQTYDSTTHRHYVDGVLEMEKPLANFVPHGPGRVGMGQRLNRVSPYKGALMRARFANRALQPADFLKVPAALKA